MLSSWLVALSVAVTPGQCATCGPAGGGMAFSPGMTAGSWTAGMGGFGNPYDAVAMGGGGGGDQLFPFDSPEPWLYGYFQEIPAYGGYASFRPHNYKHVLAQMDVAGRWGISPTMAYSHQWYHRYRQRAGMHPNYGTPYAMEGAPSYGDLADSGVSESQTSDHALASSTTDRSLIQAAAMERGYAGTPIPGIAVPDYQLPRVPEGQSALGHEYLSRIDQMQQYIDQQAYQMQLLQQQLRNASVAQANSQYAVPARHQDGQYQNQQYQHPQYQQPQGWNAQPGNASWSGQAADAGSYGPAGYQELPPPPPRTAPGAFNGAAVSPQATYPGAPTSGLPGGANWQSPPSQGPLGSAGAPDAYAVQPWQPSAFPGAGPQPVTPQAGQPLFGYPGTATTVAQPLVSPDVRAAGAYAPRTPETQAYYPPAAVAGQTGYPTSAPGSTVPPQGFTGSTPYAGLVPMNQAPPANATAVRAGAPTGGYPSGSAVGPGAYRLPQAGSVYGTGTAQ